MARCVYVCSGLVGVIAGCLGAVVLCKLCHSSLPGPAAGPASLCCPSVTVNTQLISAPCRLEHSIWSARHARTDTHKHKHKHAHVRMGDRTVYMQMTDSCTCSHGWISHGSPLLPGGGGCCSHSGFSGIHLSPYHNGDAAWAPGPWRLVSVCPAFDANLGAGGSLSCPLVRAENDCIPYSRMVAEGGGG